MVRNGVSECYTNSEDEISFISDCNNKNNFLCLDKSRCMPRSFLCNGYQDCIDASDEVEFCDFPTMYRVFMPTIYIGTWYDLFRSKNLVEENVNFNSTEIYLAAKSYIAKNMFGLKCNVAYANKNDLLIDQMELKLKVRKTVKSSNVSQCIEDVDRCFDSSGMLTCYKCFDGTIISTSQVCDNIIDCEDVSDECLCRNSNVEPLCNFLYFDDLVVKDKNISSLSMLCDLKVDLDLSLDEKYCDFEHVVKSMYKKKRKFRDSYECKNNFDISNNKSKQFIEYKVQLDVFSEQYMNFEDKLCNYKIDCYHKDDECSSMCFKVDNYKDMLGQYDLRIFMLCFEFLFEKQENIYIENKYMFRSKNRSEFELWNINKNRIEKVRDSQKSPIENFYDGNQYIIYDASSNIKYINKRNNFSIIIKQIHFEKSKSYRKVCSENELSCPWFFRCKSNKFELVEVGKVCDFEYDCKDQSDEKYCSDKTHFNCTKGSRVSIDKNKVNDGELDCSDFSDECRETAISSAKEMIKDSWLRFYIWLSSLGMISLNFLVIIKNFKKIKKTKNKTTGFCNIILITNLAFSDVLFGFVLFSVKIRALVFTGEYCSYDFGWRSSLQCTITGLLTLVSSQTSLNILLLITGFRLYTVYNPYKSLDVKYYKIYAALAFCWLASIILAVIPIFYARKFATEGLISSSLFFDNAKYERVVPAQQIFDYIEKTEKVNNAFSAIKVLENESFVNIKDSKDWYFNNDRIKTNHPHKSLEIKMIFGFYSYSSVCFPNLYSQDWPASSFSLCLMLNNLTIIVLICVGYLFIFDKVSKNNKKVHKETNSIKTQSKKESETSKTQEKMLKRISLIIATDVICWMPIIIMSFISFSGYQIPAIFHPISSIVVLPFNSLLNPILYTRFDLLIQKKVKSFFEWFKMKN